MTLSRDQRRAQGQPAEARFRAWLDRCVLPHLLIEQSPLTLPQALKGGIKRPDFLVGIPAIGTLGLDVKAKSIYDDTIIIDAYEHRTLLNFETFFSMSVWFACRPPHEMYTCLLVKNRSLASLSVTKRKDEDTNGLPRSTRLAEEQRDLMAALMGAISLG